MSGEKHSILGGKVHVYRRPNSPKWQCSSFLNGKNHRVSTKEESLKLAKEFAEDWYLTLRGKHSRGEPSKTFSDAIMIYNASPKTAKQLIPIVQEIGDMPLGAISGALLKGLGPKLKPKASTDKP